MKRLLPFFLSIALLLLTPTLLSAQTPQVPVYKPPQAGEPSARFGGGSRGAAELDLSPLAPDHAGYTVNQKPVIYWYLSQATENPLEFVMTDGQAIAPLVRTRLGGANKPGIHRIDLSKYK